MASKHELNWFQKRVGALVNRNGKTFKIQSKEAAPYCYDLQQNGYCFEEKVSTSAPPNVCLACEG